MGLKRYIRVGSLHGIELRIAYSWFIIFSLVIFSLANAVLPLYFPELVIFERIIFGVIIGVLFFVSVVAHEFAHALVAKYYGLKIDRITLFIFGGAAELQEEPGNAKVEFNMAAAGPLTSIAIGLFFGLLWSVNAAVLGYAAVGVIAQTLAIMNVGVAIFNLLPGYPLDGGRILRSAVWFFTNDFNKASKVALAFGRSIAWLLILWGTLNIMVGNFLGGVWLIVIGFFLNSAAMFGYHQSVIQRTLKNIPTRHVIDKQIVSVNPYITVREFLEKYAARYPQSVFPVVENDKIIGLITTGTIDKIGMPENADMPIFKLMQTKTKVVDAETSAARALAALTVADAPALPVVKDGKFIGLVSRDNILRQAAIRQKLSNTT